MSDTLSTKFWILPDPPLLHSEILNEVRGGAQEALLLQEYMEKVTAGLAREAGLGHVPNGQSQEDRFRHGIYTSSSRQPPSISGKYNAALTVRSSSFLNAAV